MTNNNLCVVATNLIVAVGILGFAYVGHQVSHGGGKINIMVESPNATALPVGSATSTQQSR